MKKLKHLLPALVTFALAFVLVFTVACSGSCKKSPADNGPDLSLDETEPEDNLALQDITVSDYKSSFVLGDEFETGDITVYAELLNLETLQTESVNITDQITASDIDSSEFDSSAVGTYKIYVSYTRSRVTRSATYSVKVNSANAEPDWGGISVEFKPGTETMYMLSPAVVSVELDPSDVVIKSVNSDGTVSDNVLDPDEYVMGLYKGSVEQDSWTVTGGVYTVQVYLKDDPTAIGFVNYFVIDELVSVAFKDGTTTQERAFDDVMSSTWTFTATYASGNTAEISAADSGITIPEVDANSRTDSNSVTVTYKEVNALGTSKTVTCKVTYTLTGLVKTAGSASFNADSVSADKGIEGATYSNLGVSFTFNGSFQYDGSAKTITLPDGYTNDAGANSFDVSQRVKSGSAAPFITFTVNRDFTIYVYALSASSTATDRYMTLSGSGTTVSDVEGYGNLSSFVDVSGNPSARAAAVTGVNGDVTFTLGVSAAINFYYILIVFE